MRLCASLSRACVPQLAPSVRNRLASFDHINFPARRQHSVSGNHHQGPQINKPIWTAHISSAPAASHRKPAASEKVDMEVTRHNFEQTMPAVRQALEECQFFAIDCEMTGLFVNGRGNGRTEGKAPVFLDDIEDRYEEMLESSRAFSINQFGLSAFVWDAAEQAWCPRTFNFYTFPRAFEEWQPRFLCQADSLEFLSSCHFDFNKWINEGISCMPLSLRNAKLNSLERAKSRRDILPTKEEDIAVVDATAAAVAAWLAPGDAAAAEQLLLPVVNSYHRALQYQTLRNRDFGAADPPGFLTERIKGEDGRAQLRLSRASSAEVAEFNAEEQRRRVDAIKAAAAFSQVIEAMRECEKPVVGHNCALDLAYTLNQFARPLPPTWGEYKDAVRRYFPGGVFDTKHIARQFPSSLPATGLGELFEGLVTRPGAAGDAAEPMSVIVGDGNAAAGESGQPEVMAAKTGVVSSSSGDEGEDEEVEVVEDGKGDVAPEAAAVAAVAASEVAFAAAGAPPVRHAAGFERYLGAETSEFAHEAGYDAFMTGAVFTRLGWALDQHKAKQSETIAAAAVSPPEVVEEAIPQTQKLPEQGGAEDEEVEIMLAVEEEAAEKPEAMQIDTPLDAILDVPAEGGTPFVAPTQVMDTTAALTLAAADTDAAERATPLSAAVKTPEELLAPAAGAAPYFDALDVYCWRINLSRTDLPYAALYGDDPIPARANFLYVKNLAPDQFRHWKDLSACFEPHSATLGDVRTTLLGWDQSAALVELQSEDSFEAAAAVMRAAAPGCTVAGFAEFRADKALQRAGMEEERAAGSPAKRKRAEGGGGGGAGGEKGWKEKLGCSVM